MKKFLVKHQLLKLLVVIFLVITSVFGFNTFTFAEEPEVKSTDQVILKLNIHFLLL